MASSLRRFVRVFSSFSGDSPTSSSATVECLAYRMSMLRPPPTVGPWHLRRNSCSLIGTVVRPVTRFAWNDPTRIGAYTVLDVKSPSLNSDSSSFKMLLDMKGRLAVIALKHLKPDDFIYVYGHLTSYEKLDTGGKYQTFHKVFVEDLNFVKCDNQIKYSNKSRSSSEEFISPISGVLDKEGRNRNRLHLWHIFFANPYEWWDNRQGKPHPNYPDFKHKDTHECLWLKPDDPAWIRRQLELYDLKVSDYHGNVGRRLKVRQWNIEEI